ncbi:hypothetical protein RchiOBHm_Chr1g0380781 [Rosa chinensis]|uniref:Uncharacterized protein n=1 Tax=Rosa chinensis TaxID=74649 RepID=A0A2P6SP15_ROSCH|nr:hypothetical protein RchiOBHm_Chr1g0380781 [Rosa chinensis]
MVLYDHREFGTFFPIGTSLCSALELLSVMEALSSVVMTRFYPLRNNGATGNTGGENEIVTGRSFVGHGLREGLVDNVKEEDNSWNVRSKWKQDQEKLQFNLSDKMINLCYGCRSHARRFEY